MTRGFFAAIRVYLKLANVSNSFISRSSSKWTVSGRDTPRADDPPAFTMNRVPCVVSISSAPCAQRIRLTCFAKMSFDSISETNDLNCSRLVASVCADAICNGSFHRKSPPKILICCKNDLPFCRATTQTFMGVAQRPSGFTLWLWIR